MRNNLTPLNNILIRKPMYFLAFSLILSLLTIIISNYSLYGIIVLVVIIFAFVFGEQFVLSLVIISLFTLVGDVSTQLRVYIHVIDFGILGVVFLRTYELDFSSYPKLPKSLIYFLILYYISMIVSTIFSENMLEGFVKIGRQSVFFIVAYFLYGVIKSQKEIKTYLLSIVVVSIILTISSIVFFSIEGFKLLDIAAGIRYRVSSIISNVDATTAFFIVSFPLIVASLVSGHNRLFKFLHWFVILFIALGLFLTISRSAYLAIFFSLMFLAFYLNRKLFIKLVSGILVLVILFLTVEPLSNISSLLFRIDSGLSQRDHLWVIASDIIADNWLLGIGPGNYVIHVYNYFPVMLNSWFGNVIKETIEITAGSNLSHSFFLVFFSDMGLLGVITAIALPFVYFKLVFKTIKRYKNYETKTFYIILGISAAGAGMFIRGIVDSIGLLSYGFLTADMPFWLMFICLIYYYQNAEKIALSNNDKEQISL